MQKLIEPNSHLGGDATWKLIFMTERSLDYEITPLTVREKAETRAPRERTSS